MYSVKRYPHNRIRRKARVRKKVYGTLAQPRLSVFRSNKYIYAQIIDDTTGKTLVSSGVEVKALHSGANKSAAAYKVGQELAKKAKQAKIDRVVLDRNGYKYHGRVKLLADVESAEGLNF